MDQSDDEFFSPIYMLKCLGLGLRHHHHHHRRQGNGGVKKDSEEKKDNEREKMNDTRLT